MAINEQATKVQILDNMFAPELFASLASSFFITAGSVTIKFVSLRWDNSIEPAVQRAVVVARLVMPLGGAQTLAIDFQNFLTKHGLQQAEVAPERRRASDVLAETSNL